MNNFEELYFKHGKSERIGLVWFAFGGKAERIISEEKSENSEHKCVNTALLVVASVLTQHKHPNLLKVT